MKKLVSLLLAALMLTMTSCGNSGFGGSSESSLSSLESSAGGDSSLNHSEISAESEELSTEESSESSSDKESSSSSDQASKPAQGQVSSTISSKPAESSKPASESSSSSQQQPPIPKPESSSSSSSPSKPSTSVNASTVYDAMDRAVAARHEGVDAAIMNMPMSIDDSILTDMFGISSSDVVSYKGVCAGSMTNCDIMLVVEAKDGKIDTVKKALQDKQEAQKKQFEHYGVMGNIERLEASKVVSNGNFAALLIVGIMGENEENYDCAGDVSAASSAFTNVLKK